MNTMTETMTLGIRLVELRRAAGISQMELCRRTGLSLTTICAIEQGRREDPGWLTALALADALGVGVGELRDLPEVVAEPPPKRARPKKR